jgi:hypothetical protein
MIVRTIFIVSSIALLAGCVYAGPSGYNAGYAPGSPYYNGYSYPAYQTGYQPAYRPAQATYPAYVYRSAPSAYPLYSPTFPSYGAGGNGG